MTFFLQEVIVRACYPVGELANFDRSLYVNALKNDSVGKFVRNQTYSWRSFPDTSHVFLHQYNFYGFRDKNWTVNKTSQQRVMFVGDSFVEGVMVDQDCSLPAHFQRLLGHDIEVMNFGILGAGMEKYLQLIADAVPIFNPDMVVVFIYANDFNNHDIQIPEHYLEPEFHDATTPRFIKAIKTLNKGAIPFRFSDAVFNCVPDTSTKEFPFKGRIPSMYQNADVELVDYMIQGNLNPFRHNEISRLEDQLRNPARLLVPLDFIRYYAEKFDFEPLIVYVPDRNQLTDHYLQFEHQLSYEFPDNISLTDSLYQRNRFQLRAECESLGLECLDMSDTLSYLENHGIRAYWNYDQHMNSRGYSTMATKLLQSYFLEKVE